MIGIYSICSVYVSPYIMAAAFRSAYLVWPEYWPRYLFSFGHRKTRNKKEKKNNKKKHDDIRVNEKVTIYENRKNANFVLDNSIDFIADFYNLHRMNRARAMNFNLDDVTVFGNLYGFRKNVASSTPIGNSKCRGERDVPGWWADVTIAIDPAGIIGRQVVDKEDRHED